jgi:hypothetical protein
MEPTNHHQISRVRHTGVSVKMIAGSTTVALNDIYHAFLIFQSYISYVINLFIQKEKVWNYILYLFVPYF